MRSHRFVNKVSVGLLRASMRVALGPTTFTSALHTEVVIKGKLGVFAQADASVDTLQG